jgi:hypothetical protein
MGSFINNGHDMCWDWQDLLLFMCSVSEREAYSNVVGWGTMLVGSSPDVIGFFNWPTPSSRTMDLGWTWPLTEMSARNLPGGKGRPVHEADNLTAICEPSV